MRWNRNIFIITLLILFLLSLLMGCVREPSHYYHRVFLRIDIDPYECEKLNESAMNNISKDQGYSIRRSLFIKEGRSFMIEKEIRNNELTIDIIGPKDNTTNLDINYINETNKNYHYNLDAGLDIDNDDVQKDGGPIEEKKELLKSEVSKLCAALNFTVDWTNVTFKTT